MSKLKKIFFVPLIMFSALLGAQTFNGTVVDSEQLPLPGATILNLTSSEGITSDFNGQFSIEASIGDVLQISYVGYQTSEINVTADNNSISIQLEVDNELEEVVVTSLGISREKKSLGYAITQVSGENVNTVKDNNLANSLSGKVAGLQISQSGSLGSASRITIRGNNSLGGDTQALIIVDGMPINSSIPDDGEGGQNFAGSNDGGGQPSYEPSISGAGISDINPDDVESVTVLKGPSAAALYGSRAGNGVILITTKKGSKS